MEINQIIKDLKIIDYTHEGQGIAKYEGMVIFVPNVLKNELIDLKITKISKKIAYGEKINISTSSSNRITPQCQYFYQCGGCNLQHMNYKEQTEFKLSSINNTLAKNKINFPVTKIVETEKILDYRNKVTFHFGIEAGEVFLGFKESKTNKVININHCDLISENLNQVSQTIKKYFNENTLDTVCTEENPKGNLEQLLLRENSIGEVLVCLITKKNRIYEEEKFLEYLIATNSNIKSVNIVRKKYNKQTKNWNYKINNIYGEEFIYENINGIKYTIHPFSFFQVNSNQMKTLHEEILKIVNYENKVILDAYCGIGSIGLSLAPKAQKVIGIDNVPSAIEDAKINAKINKISNVEFICDDIIRQIDYLETIKCDVVVVDPPRKGMNKKFIEFLLNYLPQELIYVSCNPATLARDLTKLEEKYKITQIECIDMFPQTIHIETIVKMEKK